MRAHFGGLFLLLLMTKLKKGGSEFRAIKKPPEGGSLISRDCLLNSFDHVFNNFLRITEDHHCFVHVEQLVI